MLRYVAFICTEESLEAHAAYRRTVEAAKMPPCEFSLGYQTETACLLYTDTVPGRIHTHRLGSSGVVMGTLFRTAGGASGPIASLSDGEVEETVTSRGDFLVRRHWGQYVAIIRNPDGIWRVVRDPTGGFPCYYVCSRGIVIIFSHLSDCARLLPTKLSVNYSHVHAFLDLHRVVPRDTGFNEIEAVHTGEAIDFRGGSATRCSLWDPLPFCCSPADHENAQEGTLRIREAVTKCVHSWAACRGSILHELSGGLDSSIVLACLAAAPSAPRIACCTHATDSPEGDERYYARLMAHHVHMPLIELQLRPKAWNRIEDLVRVRDPISPLFTAFQCGEDSEIADVAEAGEFECTFSGQGGDHLFHRTLPGITAADYAWVHGLSSRLIRVIIETSHVSRQPVWRIARHALEYGYLRRCYDVWRGLREPSFIRVPSVDLARSCHPWLAARTLLPPAKLLQIVCLTDLQTYFATPRPYVDEIHPLISQPLIECCLRIPTYILSHGGTDRTLARAAFRDVLPPEIAERASKGAVNQFFYGAVYGNREHIRQLLMNGLLAEQGLLDRAELKTALDDPTAIARGLSLAPIMTAAVCEMWLRTATSLVRSTGLPAAI